MALRAGSENSGMPQAVPSAPATAACSSSAAKPALSSMLGCLCIILFWQKELLGGGKVCMERGDWVPGEMGGSGRDGE